MPKRKKRREKRKKFWSDFKTFISKGNVVDLAVALVVGSAFNKIVSQNRTLCPKTDTFKNS